MIYGAMNFIGYDQGAAIWVDHVIEYDTTTGQAPGISCDSGQEPILEKHQVAEGRWQVKITCAGERQKTDCKDKEWCS
jgi:hypothetical protein